MKQLRYLIFFVASLALSTAFYSCEDESCCNGNATEPVIYRVFLEDANSTVPDREVSFARLGQTIRIEGENLIGLTKVFFNGYDNNFNPAFITNTSMVVQIDSDVSIIPNAGEIRLEKGDKFTVFPFDIRSAAPSITGISHTMPAAGDTIVITGSGLQNISSITFPGNIVVSEGIISDDLDGKFCIVTVPEGITTSGEIKVIGVNGGAYSPAYFNFKEGLFHNFDNVLNYSWGFIANDTPPLTDVIPLNRKPQSQNGYQAFNGDSNNPTGANVDQRFWLNSTNLITIMSNALPGTTTAENCGIQMDIYVEGEWNSGIIRFVMADGWGTSKYCMIYQPVYVDNKYDKSAFQNPGAWFTITLPFSSSPDFEGKTLNEIIAQMNAATYKQCGPWFENSGIADVFEAVTATQKINFDNIRIVPLAARTFDDFANGEETAE